jgi:GxxExxY protein
MDADRETRDPQTHAIIGAAMEVHSQLGPGFLEPVYQEALAAEFRARAIPFQREVEVVVFYKGQRLACGYRSDFLCYDSVLVEIKALQNLSGTEDAQVLNYLKGTRLERALLLNFGRPRLEYRRLVLSQSNP